MSVSCGPGGPEVEWKVDEDGRDVHFGVDQFGSCRFFPCDLMIEEILAIVRADTLWVFFGW